MRSLHRDKRSALSVFADTYDIRRAVWTEHRRKVREARERDSARIACVRAREMSVSSSMAEVMRPAPEAEHVGVSHE